MENPVTFSRRSELWSLIDTTVMSEQGNILQRFTYFKGQEQDTESSGFYQYNAFNQDQDHNNILQAGHLRMFNPSVLVGFSFLSPYK